MPRSPVEPASTAITAGCNQAFFTAAMVAGLLVALVLGVFAISYFVDQVIVGVVLNVLVIGLTSFMFTQVLAPNTEKLNTPPRFDRIPIPLLSEIPILGPVLFRQTRRGFNGRTFGILKLRTMSVLEDGGGVGQPPLAGVLAGEPPHRGLDHDRPAGAQRRDVRPRRRVLPHLGVHRGRVNDRARRREQRVRE